MDERQREIQRRKRMAKKRRLRRRRRRLLLVGIAAVLVILIALICVVRASIQHTAKQQTDTGSAQQEEQTTQKTSVSLIAVGNNRISSDIIASVDKGNNTYDFSTIYSDVKEQVSAADIAVVSQEATNWESADVQKQSVQALADTGFDVVSFANEHILDYSADGVYDILKVMKKQDNVLVTGINSAASNTTQAKYLERNGLKIAFLAYCDDINPDELPKDNPQLVDTAEEEQIARDLEAAKQNCDVVVVQMHWGDTFQTEPDNKQKETAQFLADNGADIIIGGHSYVCQKCEWLDGKNGKKVFCAYSLGSFISSEGVTDAMGEAMLQLTITRDENGDISIEDTGIIPLVCDYREGNNDFRVRLLRDYTSAMAEKHALAKDGTDGLLPWDIAASMQDVFGDFLVSDYLPTEKQQPKQETRADTASSDKENSSDSSTDSNTQSSDEAVNSDTSNTSSDTSDSTDSTNSTTGNTDTSDTSGTASANDPE